MKDSRTKCVNENHGGLKRSLLQQTGTNCARNVRPSEAYFSLILQILGNKKRIELNEFAAMFNRKIINIHSSDFIMLEQIVLEC